MSDLHQTRKLAFVFVLVLNLAMYAVGFILATRVFGSVAPRVMFVPLCYLAVGAVAGLWSQKWWSIVLGAAGGYLWGLGALKWAIHLTDTRGEYAPPMTQYVVTPSVSDLLVGIIAVAVTTVGWWVSRRLRLQHR